MDPNQHFTPLQRRHVRALRNPVPWQSIKDLSCFQCLSCFWILVFFSLNNLSRILGSGQLAVCKNLCHWCKQKRKLQIKANDFCKYMNIRENLILLKEFLYLFLWFYHCCRGLLLCIDCHMEQPTSFCFSFFLVSTKNIVPSLHPSLNISLLL